MMDFEKQIDCYQLVPNEIFIHIFGFLPIEDRKNVRLTCRWFYKLCDYSIIQSAEVIVLRGTFNSVPALHCLSRSSRRIQNIKLRRMHLNTETVRPFFEQQGAHVRSLNLMKCSFDQGAVKVMIEHCTQLSHFSVTFFAPGYENFLNDFEDLANNSIVRECVTDFSFKLTPIADSFINRKILHFFTVFPKICKLNLDIRVLREGLLRVPFYRHPRRSPDLLKEVSFLSQYILDCLSAMADQLEVLNLYFDGGVPDDIFNIRMKNLKQLSFSWFYDLPDISSISRSSLFQQLTHFSCSLLSNQENDAISSVVQRLLKFTPLQSLTIGECQVLDRTLFEAMVKSKLRTLVFRKVSVPDGSLSIYVPNNSEPSSVKNCLMPNYHLWHLSVGAHDRGLALIFATYFRSVKCLYFAETNEVVLQNVLVDQTNIRYLCLHNDSDGFKELSYFQDWLRNETTVNREFRYLTKLKILEANYALTSFLLTEFVFPNLKNLTIFLTKLDEPDADQLYHLISKLPQLQTLSFELQFEMPYSQWLTVCKGSTRLRYFHVYNHCDALTSSEYVQLFDVSPSLRRVEHDWGTERFSESRRCKYFSYDVIEKTIVEKQFPVKHASTNDTVNCGEVDTAAAPLIPNDTT